MTVATAGGDAVRRSGLVALVADMTIETPAARTEGLAYLASGSWRADFVLAAAPDGFTWRLGPVGGPHVQVAAGAVSGFALATEASGLTPQAEAYIVASGGSPSSPAEILVSYPAPASAPQIELSGDYTVVSDFKVGDSVTETLPTAITPGVTFTRTARYFVSPSDPPETPVATDPIGLWATVPLSAEAYHVRFRCVASAAGLPDRVLETPLRLILPDDDVTVTLQTAFTPDLAEADEASLHPLRNYKVEVTFSGNNEGVAVQDSFAHSPMPLLAMEMFSGQTRTLAGGATGQARVVAQMKRWLTGNRAPAGRSGYNAQYETRFIILAVMLRLSPVWALTAAEGGFSAAEKARIRLVMIGCAIGSLWVLSDANPFANGSLAGEERTVRGYKAQRGGVPNYSLPVRLTPFVVDAFLQLDGESLQGVVTAFDRDAFAAEVLAAGELTDLYDTYRQDWTLDVMRAAHPGMVETYGPGPTKAQLHTALRDGHAGGVFRCLAEDGFTGYTLDMGHEMFVAETTRMFAKRVKPGPSTYGAGLPLPGRVTTAEWPVGHGLVPTTGIAANVGVLRGVVGLSGTDGWDTLPNAGALGAFAELETIDGGGGGQPAVRHGPSYVWHGSGAHANLFAAGAALGVIDRAAFTAANPDALDASSLAERMRVGVVDMDYRTAKVGDREYTKGNQEEPNKDWTQAFLESQGGRYLPWLGMWRMILRWLGVEDLELWEP